MTMMITQAEYELRIGTNHFLSPPDSYSFLLALSRERYKRQKATPEFMERFLKTNQKYKDTPIPHIPDPKDVHSGYRDIKIFIGEFKRVLDANIFHAFHGRAWVGDKFKTLYFEEELKYLPSKNYSCFSIASPDK
jgi:hypothetical protein